MPVGLLGLYGHCFTLLIYLLQLAGIIDFREVNNKLNLRGIINKKKTPWPLVRERTIPTDRPPLVDEI
jgi:hypothetical protein